MKASEAPTLPVHNERGQKQQQWQHGYRLASCPPFTPSRARFDVRVLLGVRWDDVEFLALLLFLLLLRAVLHLQKKKKKKSRERVILPINRRGGAWREVRGVKRQGKKRKVQNSQQNLKVHEDIGCGVKQPGG